MILLNGLYSSSGEQVSKMSKSGRIANHWVPQSYLKFFAIPEDNKRIWRIRKDGNASEKKRIETVPIKRRLYVLENEDGSLQKDFEDRLAKEIDPIFASATWKSSISEDWAIDDDEYRKMLTLSVGPMVQRNPKFLDEYSKRLGDVSPREAKRLWVEYIGSLSDFHRVASRRCWSIIKDQKSRFITSDNPALVMGPNLRIADFALEESVLVFPLSPSRLLYISDDRRLENAFTYATDEQVMTFNAMQFDASIEHAFTGRPPDVVVAELDAHFGVSQQFISLQ